MDVRKVSSQETGVGMSPVGPSISPKVGFVLLGAIIWGIAGGFFGIVYLAFLKHLQQAGPAVWQIPLAAAVAGAVVSTFYSAMRVALVGALAGATTSLVCLTVAPSPLTPWQVMALCGLVGLALGMPASAFLERRRGALVVAGAGLTTGAMAGICVSILAKLGPYWSGAGWAVFIMVPMTGLLFTVLTLALGPRVKAIIPRWFGVCLACAVMASVVGVSLWALAASFRLDVDPQLRIALQAMFAQIPEAVLGGIVGGALGGSLLELLHLPRLYRI